MNKQQISIISWFNKLILLLCKKIRMFTQLSKKFIWRWRCKYLKNENNICFVPKKRKQAFLGAINFENIKIFFLWMEKSQRIMFMMMGLHWIFQQKIYKMIMAQMMGYFSEKMNNNFVLYLPVNLKVICVKYSSIVLDVTSQSSIQMHFIELNSDLPLIVN